MSHVDTESEKRSKMIKMQEQNGTFFLGIIHRHKALKARWVFLLSWNDNFLRKKPLCWGFVTLWCVSGSGDPCHWLIDPDPDPDQTPTLTLRMKKKKYFSPIFFSFKLPTGTFFSALTILLKFCVKILFCKQYFRKEKDPGLRSGSLTNGSGSGTWRTKKCGSCGSGSPTLLRPIAQIIQKNRRHSLAILCYFQVWELRWFRFDLRVAVAADAHLLVNPQSYNLRLEKKCPAWTESGTIGGLG